MRVLTEVASKQLVARAGVPVPEGRVVSDVDAAREVASGLGWPVVCKAVAEGLAHKTEVGGVVLGIGDEEELRAAAARMLAMAGEGGGVLVERQVPPGVELIVGAKRDPVFGPVVMVGLGGVFAELLGKPVVRLCPVDEAGALAMLGEMAGARVLDGYRGGATVERAAVARVIAALSQLMLDEPGLSEVDLNPVIAGSEGAVAADALVVEDERSESPRRGQQAGMAAFFEARSVAVVGASTDERKGGNVIVRNLLRFGFPGRVVPVHPTADEIAGLRAWPSLAAIPEPVELAVVVVPKEALWAVLEDAAQAGTRHLIISTAGLADLGGEGAAEQAALLERARALGLRVMGPNSIGTINGNSRLVTSITTLTPPAPGGRIALFGQTGTFASGYANWFATRGRPAVGKIACIGNKGDVDEAALLTYFAEDSETEVVGMYTEGVSNPEFFDALRTLRGHKPVVVLRAGRTEAGRAAIASHTGSLVGDDAVYGAAFAEAGAVPADSLEELFLTLEAFDVLPLPRGRNVGVVSITGIGCVLASDAAGRAGMRLPTLGEASMEQIRQWIPDWAPARNPFDIWSAIEKHGPAVAFEGIATATVADPAIDALVLNFVLIEESAFDVRALAARLRVAAPGKPIVATFFGGTTDALRHWTDELEAAGVLVAPGPDEAFRVLSHLASFYDTTPAAGG